MPRFRYTAKNKKGETVVDLLDAYDRGSLVQTLQAKELFVLKVEEIDRTQALKDDTSAAKKSGPKKFNHKKVKLTIDNLVILESEGQ